MSSPLQPGAIVEVFGLQNAPQYNGGRGIVLGESKPDQKGNLRHPIRLFAKGKVLDAKVDNLKKSRDLEKWKTNKLGGTLMELIRSKPTIAGEDNCGDFATKLWAELAEEGPAHPLFIDHYLNLRNEILTAPGHKMFWLALDAVGHHLLIEKCNGKFRVYQSFITQHGFGYTAGQWCFGDLRGKPAWTKLGGGKLLGSSDINALLDIVLMVGPEGCTEIGLNPATRQIAPGRSDVEVLIGGIDGEHVFSIPAGLYNKCDDLNRKMTGEPFNPATFLFMLNTGVWWERRQDTSGSAVGFSFRAMDLGIEVSEEEGIRRAEAMTQAARNRWS